MNISMIRLLVVAAALCGSMPSLASEPASTPTAAAPTTPVSDATKPAAAAASVAAAARTQDAAASDPGSAQPARVPAGYKSKLIDGETVYCRKSTPMGTRFPTEVCMTVAQYEDSIRDQNALRQELTGKQKSYSTNY